MTKVLKTSLAMLLAFVMLIGALPFSVSAATPSMIISVSTKNAMAGQTVDLDVMVKDNPGVAAISLDIDYDKDNLTLTGFTYNTEALVGAQTTPYNESASIPTLYMVNGTANITGDFKLATLTFAVKESAKNNVAAYVRLSYDPDNIYDITETNIDTVIENGAINIIACVPGDINGDEKVNSKDVSRLMQYHAHWNVDVNEPALDTNGDGKLNSKDVTRLMQYIAHWNVDLYPVVEKQGLKSINVKAATCEEDGNIAYWFDTENKKYYKDAAGMQEIAYYDTIIKALGHSLVNVQGYPPTTENEGLTDGVKCSTCNKWIQEQTIIPKLSTDEFAINYKIYGNDSYLQSIEIDNSFNPITYTSEDGVPEFAPLTVAGYTFEGWYDAPGNNGLEVKSIPKGTKGNKTLFARWSQEVYDITYKLYQTPLKPINDENFLHYTTGKGLVDLPNPTLYNYIFLGWYTNDGKEVKSIPAGTVGDITLNAYWTSKRNLTKSLGKPSNPYLLENKDEGIIYFTYEIGTIENVPLTDAIWTIQAVSGLSQQQSSTVTKQISEQNAQEISNTISNSTVDSGTWTLSEAWNESTSVTESWANQHGMTKEKANEVVKSSSNTFAFTSSSGGSESQTDNTGTTTLDYNSQNYEHGNGVELGANAHYNAGIEVGGKIGIDELSAVNLSGKAEWGIGIEGKYTQQQKWNEHTGTDTTTLDTHTHTGTSTWNSTSSASSTRSASESNSYKEAISELITNTKGYGQSYSNGGSNSQTQGHSTTESESVNTSSTLTYATTDITTTTSTYSTDGKSEGCYRLVIAGTIHVFGVVGYDIGSESYFAYTYNVMDDKTYEFLDYAPDLGFNDYENGCIPFEVPIDIYNYVNSSIACTEGLSFRTNSINGTAIVSSYNGIDTDVKVPSYIVSSGRSYKVTGISSTAFAGKPVRAVILGRYIEDIPDNAFRNCTNLHGVSGYFTSIGANAFSGCTSLESFIVPGTVTSIGENAFKDVANLNVKAISLSQAIDISMDSNPQESDEPDDVYKARINEIATSFAHDTTQSIISAAVNSGAKNVSLNLEKVVDGTALNITVPKMNRFEIKGGRRDFKNFRLNTQSTETVLSDMTISECSRIPLEIHSDSLTLDAVNVTSPSFCLLLSENNVTVNLKRDSILKSENEKTVVCKNPIFVSISDDSGAISTDGVIDIIGNVYVCGKIIGEDNITITNGKVCYISESEFENYIKGVLIVTFNPNGGSVPTTSKELVFGSEFGVLPIPTRDGFEFLGWFNDDELITADTVATTSNDITLDAHWLSDWVPIIEVPNSSEISSEKWTYLEKETTSSGSSSEDGWTRYDKQRTGWGATHGPVYSDPNNGSRNVWSESYVTSSNYKTVYHYYRYAAQREGGYGSYQWQSNYPNYYQLDLDYPLEETSAISGHARYMWWYNSSNWVGMYECDPYTTQEWVSDNYGTRWYYQDPVYTYYYYRYVYKESNERIVPSESISGVQHWAKFISKGKDEVASSEFDAIILNKDSQKPIENNQGAVILGTENHAKSQVWHFSRNNDGTYRITSFADEKAIDLAGSSTENGTKISMYNSHGGDNQSWYLQEFDDGYNLIPKCSPNGTMDLTSGSTDDGTIVQFYKWNGTAAQVFELRIISDLESYLSNNE